MEKRYPSLHNNKQTKKKLKFLANFFLPNDNFEKRNNSLREYIFQNRTQPIDKRTNGQIISDKKSRKR